MRASNIRNKVGRISLYLTMLLILSSLVVGCGKGDSYILSPQQWNDTEFVVEIRPGAPRQGMNEFVVIATDTKGVPGYNYVVSIKMTGSEHWAQMIQDGHSGVYRRAISVHDPVNDVLAVQIQHKADTELHAELQFPLAKHI